MEYTHLLGKVPDVFVKIFVVTFPEGGCARVLRVVSNNSSDEGDETESFRLRR